MKKKFFAFTSKTRLLSGDIIYFNCRSKVKILDVFTKHVRAEFTFDFSDSSSSVNIHVLDKKMLKSVFYGAGVSVLRFDDSRNSNLKKL